MYTGNRRGVLLGNLVNADCSHKIFFQKKLSLQVRGNCSTSFFCHFCNYLKRASLRLSVCVKASVSIEASVAIPIFMFCFLEILSLLNYVSVYSGVLHAMKTIGDPVCVYGYASDLVTEGTDTVSLGEKVITSVLFSEVYLDTQIRKKCTGLLYDNTVRNGAEGISLLGSCVDREDSDLSILAHYTMKPVISFAGTELTVICRYYGRLWTGYNLDGNKKTEDYVYITENGSVYHLTELCTYLKLSVSSVTKSELSEKRNNSGAKYKECNLCYDDKRVREIYYITKSGEKYHTDMNCSGLKRTIYRVERSEVDSWPLCNRCGQKESG